MTRPTRIRCVDALNNISYIHEREGRWHCTLSNGTPAAFSYGGISGDEMAVRFALEDTNTPEDALEVVRTHGARTYTYALV